MKVKEVKPLLEKNKGQFQDLQHLERELSNNQELCKQLNDLCQTTNVLEEVREARMLFYNKKILCIEKIITIIEKHKDNIKDIANQCCQKHQLIYQKYDNEIVLQADIYTDEDNPENGESIQIAIFKNNITIAVLYEKIQYNDSTEKNHIQNDKLSLMLPVPFGTIIYTVDINTSGDYEIFDWTFSSVNATSYVLTSQFSEIEIPHDKFYKHVYLNKNKADEKLQELISKSKTEGDEQ